MTEGNSESAESMSPLTLPIYDGRRSPAAEVNYSPVSASPITCPSYYGDWSSAYEVNYSSVSMSPVHQTVIAVSTQNG